MLPPPPDYLVGKLVAPDDEGPAQFLADGRWCGHGEPLFNLYDVRDGEIAEFMLYGPVPLRDDEMKPPAVKLAPLSGGESFLVYDPRRHPANLYAWDKYIDLEPSFSEPLACDQCRGRLFTAAVGFEIPSDSHSPNDTSWFALAAVCVSCGAAGIVFDDETA